MIARIESDGVVLAYKTWFDGRSFGEDMVTKDSGSFKVGWRRSTTSAPSLPD